MITPKIVMRVDEVLDANASDQYQDQPLAQDWARIAKMSEEIGEAIQELILWTGQNPRKGLDPEARERLLKELADAAMTGVYAIQHFTKNTLETFNILNEAQAKHIRRLDPEWAQSHV
jgi:hypothetical protein